jgi:DNA-binding transcriptional MerR regulator
VALKKDKIPKSRFSIKEVAEKFKVKESTLRYWEKEFDFLHPQKTNGKGVRFYTEQDIESVRLIYYLVKEKGMTLAGARQRIKDNKDNTIREEEIVYRLKKIREELLILKDAFDVIDSEE